MLCGPCRAGAAEAMGWLPASAFIEIAIKIGIEIGARKGKIFLPRPTGDRIDLETRSRFRFRPGRALRRSGILISQHRVVRACSGRPSGCHPGGCFAASARAACRGIVHCRAARFSGRECASARRDDSQSSATFRSALMTSAGSKSSDGRRARYGGTFSSRHWPRTRSSFHTHPSLPSGTRQVKYPPLTQSLSAS